MAKKYSQFPTASSVSQADSVVGLHDGENSRFSLLTIFSYLQTLFVPTTRKVNNKALSSDITLDASDVGAVDAADVGAVNGVASLDSTGKVPGTQLDLSGKQDTITANGILKGDGAGGVSAATAGTDYATPAQLEDKADQSQLAKVIGSPAGQNISVGDYVIYNGQLYISTQSFVSSVYPATYLSYLTPITNGGLNVVSKIASKEVEIPLATIGSSMTQTARLIGQCTTLFGIAATAILSIGVADAALSPASILFTGTYNDGFYIAASQICTLNSSVKFRIIYTR